MRGANRSGTAGCPACHAVGYHEIGCLFDSRSTTADETVRNFGTDRRDPTGANDRRRVDIVPEHITGDGWRPVPGYNRRQSDRRGGE